MDVSWLAVYRALLVLSAGLAIGLIYYAGRYRDEPGGKPLLVLILGGLIYIGVKLSVSFVSGTPSALTVTRLNPLGAGLAVIGFVSLAIEYTDAEYPISRRTIALLLVEPIVINVLVWVDIEYLWIPRGLDANTISGYAWELTGLAIANQLYMNVLLLAGIGLLVRFIGTSETVFRRQGIALIFAAILPVTANLTYYLGFVRFNPLPVVFVLSAALLMWAVVWTRFLDLTPISNHAVVDSLNAGLLTVDSDGRLVSFNEASQRILSLGASGTVIGRQIEDVLAAYPSFIEAYDSVTAGNDDQASIVESEGKYFAVEILPLESSDDVVGHTVVIRNVTDQKLQERSLEQKNEQLERFASVISHDIRNPLNVIQGRVDIARAGTQVESQLDVIGQNADRIERIIESALDVTRGSGVERTEPINIETIAKRAWSHVDTDEVSLETDCDFVVEGAPGRLIQLFENVFRNAVEHGGDLTEVRVGVLATNGDTSGFFIADDGVGIPESEYDAVFADGYTTSASGTGLGLTIVSDIIESHGWQLNVTESEQGGARFEISGVDTTH